MNAKRILSLAAALTLMSGSALASTTAEDLEAVWQQSFDRMNTTALPRNFVELPAENDLNYDEALSLARQAIFDKYATPPEELDAMGLYPDFIAAEEGYSASWRFYLSPLRDADIDEGHDYPAPGDYYVCIDSPSGEVTICLWYIDDFWPYAQRVWDAGKRDIVYEYAQKAGLYTLPADQQAIWLELLESAGYDLAEIRSGQALFKDGEFRSELRDGTDVDPTADSRVAAAWQAIAETYGLDIDLMRRYHYIAFYSPLDDSRSDVFIVYHSGAAQSMRRGGDVESWCARLLGEVDRLGMFLVRFDPDSGEIRYVSHGDHPALPVDEGDPALLLGRPQWSADDLTLFHEAYQNLESTMIEALNRGLSRDEQQPIADAFMRSLGGSERLYPDAAQAADIGLDAALPIAQKAAAEAAGMTLEDFSAQFATEESGYLPEMKCYEFWFMAPLEIDEIMYCVRIDAATGEVLYAMQSHGNG